MLSDLSKSHSQLVSPYLFQYISFMQCCCFILWNCLDSGHLGFGSGRAKVQVGRGQCHQSKPRIFSPTPARSVLCSWASPQQWGWGERDGGEQGSGPCFLYWYSASVRVLISSSKGSICLLSNYVTNLHPSPLRIFIPVPQRCRFPGLPEIHRLKPFSGFLVKVLISGNLTFLHLCFLDGVSLTTSLFYFFLQLIC